MIQVRIFANDQVVFETGFVPGAAGTLTGAATSCVIPKNTLADGAVFRAQVIAIRKSSSDANGYPGVPAGAFYSRATEFPLRTAFQTLDVNWYGIAKMRRFTQNSVLSPAPAISSGFGFSAFTLGTDPLNVQSTSLKLPNGKVKILSASGATWTATENFDAQTQLEAAYAIGMYEMSMQTLHNNVQKLSLSLASAPFPLPLQISNWNDASALDSTRAFALKWLPLAGATADDFIQVTVLKNGKVVFRTSDYPGGPGALDGRATSVNLPAGLLSPGEAAEVSLTYFKSLFSDPFSYPQSLGTVGSGCETRATIQAAGGSLSAAELTEAQVTNGILEFNLACADGRQQIIQVSRDLIHWSDALVTNAPAGAFLLRFTVDRAERSISVRVRTN